MRFLQGTDDPDQLLTVADDRRQIFRIATAGAIQRFAHRDPQPRRRQAGGQPIDRNDPPDVQQLVVAAHGLEVRIVDRELAAEPLQLPGDDDLRSREEPAFDEAAAEPRRLDRAGGVLEHGDRPLDAAAERGLDADIRDLDASADDGPLLHPDELPQLAHLAQVVVPPWQVEEQLADRQEPEPPARPLQEVSGAQPGSVEHRVQELGRVGGGRRWLGGPRGRCRLSGRAGSRHSYSAEIR